MKYSTLILSLLVLFTSGVSGQVMEYSVGSVQNSIVRTVDHRSVLIYTQESTTSAYFVLHNEATGTALSFPFNVGVVHDMRITDGRVYFCGESYGHGLVGTFNIQQVFFSGGNVFWHQLSSYFGDMTHVVSLDRLDLFSDSGRVCMAMVGGAWFDPLTPTPKNVLVSACFSGTNWNINCDMTKPYFMKFTDIACLDDIIVAVGTDTNDAGCYLKTYHPRMDFPGNTCTPLYGYEISFMNPQGKVLVTKYADNTASIAHFDASRATVMHKVSFSSGGTIPIGNVETWITNTSSFFTGGEMIELATSINGNTYLLQDTDYPVSGIVLSLPWLVKYSHSIAPTSSVQAEAGNYKNQSLDMDFSGMYPRTSCYASQLATYVPIANMTTPQCMHPASLPIQYSVTGVNITDMYEGVRQQDALGFAFVPVISDVRVQNICDY